MPAPTPPPDWHHLEPPALAEQLDLPPLDEHLQRGLSAEHAQQHRRQFGANRLPEQPPRPVWAIFLAQFVDVMILVLLAAAVLAGIVGEAQDALVIVIVVLLNGVLGFIQEYRAERALTALRQMAAPMARVLRDGSTRDIASADVVPGDIVLLEAGNLIPADVRLLHTAQLATQEAPLTGESTPIEKQHTTLPPSRAPVAEQSNMAFQGTLVTRGRGAGVVIATGTATQLGRIARLLQTEEGVRTPLQKRLSQLGVQLSWIVLAICVVVFVAGLLRHEPPLLMFMTAISLAVAAIPEALPAVVAVALALGSVRLVRHNALVRKLAAVETLGSVTMICSDKTGTLTENRMHVETSWLPQEPARQQLLLAAALNNDARDGTTPTGDPTELALLQMAREGGIDVDALRLAQPRIDEMPFDAERARMSTLHRDDTGLICYCKGAPESLLPLCTRTVGNHAIDIEQALSHADTMAAQGLRVLAFAQKRLTTLPGDIHTLEADLEFIGLAGMLDPPRAEALHAVRECKTAGITPVMITGDHPQTALAIARRLEIIGERDERALTGQQLTALDDDTLQVQAAQVRVYARVDPAQKIRIVKALQARGEFVAMTGDGVNDAPALKRADIGIAMGRSGTDIARDAANLVLLDDNFATIVGAVREGRRIYDNIRRFVQYALTTNSAELWLLFLAPFLGMPLPLLPIHILWVNLLTDGLPGLSLTMEPADPDVMQRPPRPPQQGLFADGLWQQILWSGILMAGCILALQAAALALQIAHWQSMVFTTLTLAQLANLLSIHAGLAPALGRALWRNRWLLAAVALTTLLQLLTLYLPFANRWLKTQPLPLTELICCFGVASIPFWAMELYKWRQRCRMRK